MNSNICHCWARSCGPSVPSVCGTWQGVHCPLASPEGWQQEQANTAALRTGNSLDNCSERCRQGTIRGQRLESKKSFPAQSDPNPFCWVQGVLPCLWSQQRFFFRESLILALKHQNQALSSRVLKSGKPLRRQDAPQVWKFPCSCVRLLFSTLALQSFPGRVPVSFHVPACSVNHYSPSCSSWLCNVSPCASLTDPYSNPAPNTELFISLGALFGDWWQAVANFILHIPLWGVGVAFAWVLDDTWGREK